VTQPGAADPVLVVVGDIHASRHWIVTPFGTVRTHGAEVTSQPQQNVSTRIPVWAIVLAVLLFPLGLLFLLVKETVFTPGFAVTVRAGAFAHTTLVGAASPAAYADTAARVEYLRRVLADAPA
jgi:hypothetical protein